jgi:uncharacterized protein (TIGR02147 family)
MSKNPALISVFDFFDYCEFLAAWYKHEKQRRYGYSYRSFSREAGIASHNFLPRIISRQRRLSKEFVPLIADYLHMSAREIRYFNILVTFNNTAKPKLKEAYLRQLLSLRHESNERRLADKQLHFFDMWYYPIIKELLVIGNFKEDYALLARKCIPRISTAQAKNAVAFLTDNGFVIRESDGSYRAVNQVISTDNEVNSAIISKYHRETIRQCADAVDAIKKEDRYFSSSTLLVSGEVYEAIKQEIYHFRKRLLALALESKNPDRVCFTGIQLLPRSEVLSQDGVAQ